LIRQFALVARRLAALYVAFFMALNLIQAVTYFCLSAFDLARSESLGLTLALCGIGLAFSAVLWFCAAGLAERITLFAGVSTFKGAVAKFEDGNSLFKLRGLQT